MRLGAPRNKTESECSLLERHGQLHVCNRYVEGVLWQGHGGQDRGLPGRAWRV